MSGGSSSDCPEVVSAMCGMVAAHNAIRAAAPGANPALPPMTWDTAWASEQANYAYPANTCDGVPYTSATFSCSTCPECGHYTQIVWRTTITVGCGVASGCSGSFPQVWVCDYLPAGNMIDRNGNLQLAY